MPCTEGWRAHNDAPGDPGRKCPVSGNLRDQVRPGDFRLKAGTAPLAAASSARWPSVVSRGVFTHAGRYKVLGKSQGDPLPTLRNFWTSKMKGGPTMLSKTKGRIFYPTMSMINRVVSPAIPRC